MRVLIAVCVCAVALLGGGVVAQPCSPRVVTEWDSGPIMTGTSTSGARHTADFCEFDDGSGPALFAAGEFVLLPQPTASPILTVVKYQDGRWRRFDNGQYLGSLSSLAAIDLSPAGGLGRSLYAHGSYGTYRWSGSAWVHSVSGLDQRARLLAWEDAQGPVLLAYGTAGVGVRSWRGTGGWIAYGAGLPAGDITSLRVVDDGTGPTLYATGPVVGGAGVILKLIGGVWTQVPGPPVGAYAIKDVAFIDDGSGAAMYATAANGLWMWRGSEWSQVPGAWSLGNLFVVAAGGGNQLWVAGNVPLSPTRVVHGLVRRVQGAWGQAIDFYRDGQVSLPHAVAPLVGEPGGGIVIGGYFNSMCAGGHPSNQSFTSADYQVAHTLCKVTPEGVRSFGKGIGGQSPGGLGGPGSDHLLSGPYLSIVELDEGPRLIATGSFRSVGGQFARNVAMYDGHAWTPMSSGSEATTFTRPASSVRINGVRRVVTYFEFGGAQYWDGLAWIPLDCPRSTLLEFDGGLYAFTPSSSSSGGAVFGLHRQSASGWEQVISGPIGAAVVCRLNSGPERLYLLRGNGLVEWDGAQFASVPGQQGAASTLAVHTDSTGRIRLFLADLASVQALDGVSWDSWTVQSGNATGQPQLTSFHDGVGPALYMAGPFTFVDGVVAQRLAVWREGVWSSAGVTPTLTELLTLPFSMAALGDKLYIAGNFFQVNNSPAERLFAVQACPHSCTDDYDGDGTAGTEDDIRAFYRCLSGDCCERCSSDFDNDGDFGTERDIEAFFRVLGGGSC